jgi:hypothetical protein
VESRARRGHQTRDAAKDENSVLFTKGQSKTMMALVDAIRHAVANRQNGYAPVQASVGDEIAKLGSLLQQGLLSRDEFEYHKARLMG